MTQRTAAQFFSVYLKSLSDEAYVIQRALNIVWGYELSWSISEQNPEVGSYEDGDEPSGTATRSDYFH
jgi:hypothetical protein